MSKHQTLTCFLSASMDRKMHRKNSEILVKVNENARANRRSCTACRHYFSGGNRRIRRVQSNHAAGVQRRLHRLATRSAHRKTLLPPRLVLTQLLQAALQPLGAVSMQVHRGGSDLVHVPHVSQHGHAPAAVVASSLPCSPISCPACMQQPRARGLIS